MCRSGSGVPCRCREPRTVCNIGRVMPMLWLLYVIDQMSGGTGTPRERESCSTADMNLITPDNGTALSSDCSGGCEAGLHNPCYTKISKI